MDVRRKLAILTDAAKYDASCASSGVRRDAMPGGLGDARGMGICHSFTPDGRCVSLLRILLTNYCVYDCQYCVSRVSSDVPRARFTPDEVVRLTIEFYRRNYIEGLFLSSGVLKSPDYTMEQMASIARRLREEERFGGYIHLKAVPGASPLLLEAAGRYADRVSANIELPTEDDLRRLAPEKTRESIEATMHELHVRHEAAREPRAPAFMPAGQSTQMIVGASPAPDLRVLETASRLYSRFRLRRVYYSAFSPIPTPDARLPIEAPPLVREHRLYQADWLLRFYGFDVNELTDEARPNLDADLDPKTAWAIRHREAFPIDVNEAPRELLLRTPGLGVKSVERILVARRHRRLRLDDLRRLGVTLRRARPFIVTADGAHDARALDSVALRRRLAKAEQLSLFGAGSE
jgi:putative DNA modification/repair radical SAM protein